MIDKVAKDSGSQKTETVQTKPTDHPRPAEKDLGSKDMTDKISDVEKMPTIGSSGHPHTIDAPTTSAKK